MGYSRDANIFSGCQCMYFLCTFRRGVHGLPRGCSCNLSGTLQSTPPKEFRRYGPQYLDDVGAQVPGILLGLSRALLFK